jgi:hypothetical protein
MGFHYLIAFFFLFWRKLKNKNKRNWLSQTCSSTSARGVKSGKPIKSTQHPEKEKVSRVLLSRRWNDDWNAGNNRVFSDSQKYWKKVVPKYFGFPFLCWFGATYFMNTPQSVSPGFYYQLFSYCQRDALKNFFIFISLRWHLKDEWHPPQFEIEKNPLLFSLAR